MPMMSDSFMDRIEAEYHQLIRNIEALKSNLSHEARGKHHAEFEELQNAQATLERKYAAWQQEQSPGQNVPALTDLNDSLTHTRSIFERLTALIKRDNLDWPEDQSEEAAPSSHQRDDDQGVIFER
ncbi:MAG TPA: hypothetical protein PKE64_27015 [Anaerolineae bacterium]|nr:hypothetical protein [Anaerolineae bacterium]